jgi:hypothetical protein
MILIIGDFHHKNKIGLINILEYLKISYKFSDLSDINNCDIVYSPSQPINTSLYPNKKFIFGPHFSLYPDNKLLKINNIFKNSVYIQPSIWPIQFWEHYDYYNNLQKSNISIPFKPFPFPVDTNKFSPNYNNVKTEVFIYFKRRNPIELTFIESFLKSKNINYKIFDYIKRYDENDYLSFLQKSKFGIILDAHESQGFAIQEALSCNVPLLVWNTQTMNQEYGSNYSNIPCTTIPYWDKRCGEFFYNINELEETFNLFISKLEIYKPREYILENLSVEKCSERFLELI